MARTLMWQQSRTLQFGAIKNATNVSPRLGRLPAVSGNRTAPMSLINSWSERGHKLGDHLGINRRALLRSQFIAIHITSLARQPAHMKGCKSRI
jgi:hypothetical protein